MIRQFQPEDAPRVKEIHKRAVFASDCYTPEQKAAWAQDLPVELWARNLQKSITLVAQLEDITGFCSITPEGELERLYVDPEYQRQGIGRELLEAIEDRGRELCVVNFTLNASLNAVRFYERNGYENLGREIHTIRSIPFEVNKMAKCITPW